jgi:Reverse transcriptase (RNA-dependent DNA polymerase)
MYTNAQGLRNNLELFRKYCENYKPKLVALSETHTVVGMINRELDIEGYDLIRCDSDSTHTGGVAFYILKECKYAIINSNFKSRTWILTVRILSEKVFDVTLIYKSPKEKSAVFFDILDNYITENLNYKSNNVIVGDINLNVATKTLTVKKYYNILSEHGFRQIVKDPTRPNKKNLNASSIIDHVIINNNNVSYNIDRNEKISDHYIIKIKYNSSNFMQSAPKICKMIKKYKKQIFLQKMCERVNHTNNNMEKLYDDLKIVMQSFVVDVDTSKSKRHKYNEKIAELKKNRCNAYNEFLVSNEASDLQKYDELNIKYKKAIKHQKIAEMQENLSKFRNDPKRLWNTLKSLYKPSLKDIKAINFNGIEIDNPEILRNSLNNFFTDSVKKLVAGIEKSMKSDYNDKIMKPNEEFNLVTIDKDQLVKYVELIKMKHFDDFVYGENIVDLISHEPLAEILLRAINDLIINSVMPEPLKISIISPIPKVDNPQTPEDYRPVNNLCCLDKLIETIVLDQMNEFLEVNKILSDTQHGFRASHSTETALITLTDNIVQSFEKKKIVLTIFLDFKRAFETIDRTILIDKLKKYNFGVETIEWFISFLSNRKQVVKINGKYSDEIDVDLGVPQGSKIANILFILYVNDLVNHLKDCSVIMYADDTSISVSCNTVSEATEIMNNVLKTVSDWLKFNRIALNISKCKYMIFENKSKKNTTNDPIIEIDGILIEKVNQIKYLGIIVDEKLNFNKNSEIIVKKLNKKLGFLRRQGSKMDEASRILYYKSLVQPHLDYCSFLLNMSEKSFLDSIQKIQNKFIRAIKMKKRMENHDLVRKEINIVNVSTRININIMKAFNRIINKNLPLELNKRITLVNSKNKFNLRHGKAYNVPKYLTKVGRKSFFYMAQELLNEANEFIKKNKLENKNLIVNYINFLSNK